FDWPMSSPQKTTMFGFLPPAAGFCCACAAAAHAVPSAAMKIRNLCFIFISLCQIRDHRSFVCRLGKLAHHLVDIEARRLLPDRELLEALQPLRNERLRRHEKVGPVRLPVAIVDAFRRALERIGPQVVEIRRPQPGELALPGPQRVYAADAAVLLEE